jgi:hypothetical protein
MPDGPCRPVNRWRETARLFAVFGSGFGINYVITRQGLSAWLIATYDVGLPR